MRRNIPLYCAFLLGLALLLVGCDLTQDAAKTEAETSAYATAAPTLAEDSAKVKNGDEASPDDKSETEGEVPPAIDRNDPDMLALALEIEEDAPILAGRGLDFLDAAYGNQELAYALHSELLDGQPYLENLYKRYWASSNNGSPWEYFQALGNYMNPDKGETGPQPDVNRAIYWYSLAADRFESCDALVALGDLYYRGKNVNQDYEKAAAYYQEACQSPLRNGIPFARLADCYDKGHGVKQDRKAAESLYLDAYIRYGNADGAAALLERIDSLGYSPEEKVNMYRMLGHSMNLYTWSMEESGLYNRKFSAEKIHNPLKSAWDNDTNDTITFNKNATERDDWFSADFIRDMKRYMFAAEQGFGETYILYDNHDGEDARTLKFEGAEWNEEGELEGDDDFLSYTWYPSDYAEYDFDGDGKKELFLRGIEGTGEYLHLRFYRKNAEGKYGYAFSLPGYQRDGFYQIRYKDGNHYFLFIQDVCMIDSSEAREIHHFDEEGRLHSIRISPAKYGTWELWSEGVVWEDEQMRFPTDETNLYAQGIESAQQLEFYTYWRDEYHPKETPDYIEIFRGNDFTKLRQSYEVADIFNDRKPRLIQKVQREGGWKKGHDARYFFNILENEADLLGEAGDLSSLYGTDYYGPRKPGFYDGTLSRGNISDYFPVGPNVVQFWCDNRDGWGDLVVDSPTYTYILHRQDNAYMLEKYLYKDGEAALIVRALYYYGPTEYKVSFNQRDTFNYWANH